MRRLLPYAAFGLLVIFALSVARAQPDSSSPAVVTGTVTDGGRPVPGARVELISSVHGVRFTTTDDQGTFLVAGLQPGAWTLRVAGGGFPVHERTIEVGAGVPVRVTVRLQHVAAVYAAPKLAMQMAAADMLSLGHVPASRFALAGAAPLPTAPPFNTEAYAHIQSNGFRRVADDPRSTFSIDVDTAAYANVRRFLESGSLPPADAVRIEELVNYFTYHYGRPAGGHPVAVATEVGTSPWSPDHRLVLIGLEAPPIATADLPPRNLVFLLDVSGSMMPPDKLPLLRTAMRLLVDQLRSQDRVAIVVYAGASGVALPSTPGDRKGEINQVLANLEAGGSTNGGEGIELAYRIAQEHFVRGGINRVILATDGDFNVGVTSEGELVRLIEKKRESGIFLSVLGVGTGNLKDATMEKLANRGNGNYAYLDSLQEARKVLVAEAGATLVTAAKDVKIQVEFNPATVGAYRLIGYENRLLRHEEFNDDRRDAGEIGAGHRVTALYEVVPRGREQDVPGVDPLKYQQPRPAAPSASGELMTVKVRYKAPDGEASRRLSAVVLDETRPLGPNLGFAAAVASWGMLLRDDPERGRTTWDSVLELARRHRGEDAEGYRAEFIRLVELSKSLRGGTDTEPAVTGARRLSPGESGRE